MSEVAQSVQHESLKVDTVYAMHQGPTAGVRFSLSAVLTGGVVYVLVAADPSGKFVYLVDEINAWGFDIDAVSGTLTAMPGAPLPAGAEPLDLTMVGAIQ